MNIFRATQVSTLYILDKWIYIGHSHSVLLDIVTIFQVFKICFIFYFFLNIMIVVALEKGKLLYEKKLV